MNEKRIEKKVVSKKEGHNLPNQPEAAVPTGKLLTLADLKLLRSAELYNLLKLKKVPGRSKFTKKAVRASALEGIVTYGDLEDANLSVPKNVNVFEPRKAEKKPVKPGKCKRLEIPVGGMDVHRDTINVAVADPSGVTSESVFRNRKNGIKDLINYFRFYGVSHAAIESTSEYWLKMFWRVTEAGIKILVANAQEIRW